MHCVYHEEGRRTRRLLTLFLANPKHYISLAHASPIILISHRAKRGKISLPLSFVLPVNLFCSNPSGYLDLVFLKIEERERGEVKNQKTQKRKW